MVRSHPGAHGLVLYRAQKKEQKMSMLTIGKFIVVFKAMATITDLPPNKCPFIYRIFGDQILKMFCDRTKHERGGEIPHDCIYNLFYHGKKITSDSYAPPFVIECDNIETTLEAGQYLEVVFTIVSPSTFWQKLIVIWKKMAEEGITGELNTFRLVNIKITHPFTNESKIIATSSDFSSALPIKFLITGEKITNHGDFLGSNAQVKKIKIDFLTPWQFHRHETGEDRQLRSSAPNFSDVISGLLIRAKNFTNVWGLNETRLIDDELKNHAANFDSDETFRRVVDFRDSQEGKHRSGLVGTMIVSGQNFVEFFPLLTFGELLHIGRGCTAGHGRMKFSLV